MNTFPWDTRSPTDDNLASTRPKQLWRHEGSYNDPRSYDDPPVYSSRTIRRSDAASDTTHPWKLSPSTSTSRRPIPRPVGTGRDQLIPQRREPKYREAAQSPATWRPGSHMPSLPTPIPNPEAAAATPVEPSPFSQLHASKGMAANPDDTLDQMKFPELIWPWRWGYVPSATTNSATKVIAPINQETQEVHGPPYNNLPFASANYNTPLSTTKDTARITLPIPPAVEQRQPITSGNPTTSWYNFDPWNTFDPDAKSRKDVSSEAKSQPFTTESPQLEDPEDLKIRLTLIRILRDRGNTEEEINKVLAEMVKEKLSFLEVLRRSKSKSRMAKASSMRKLPSNAAKKLEETHKDGRARLAALLARMTNHATPVVPTKYDIPTNCDRLDTEMGRVGPTATGPVPMKPTKSRYAIENFASAQTTTTASPRQDRWLAVDKPKLPEEKNIEEEFETLDLESDEEGWENIDRDEDWEVVEDSRLVDEKNAA